MRFWVFALAATLTHPALAQSDRNPVLITSDRELRGSAVATDGSATVGCYAISTTAGEQLQVVVQTSGFDGEVLIARGALCDANAVQARRTLAGTSPANLSLRAAGGRYLILLNRKGGQGSFRLTVRLGDDASSLPAATAIAPAAPRVGGSAGSASGPTAEPIVSARRQLMLAQVEQRRVEVAEATEQARRDAEYRRIQEAQAQIEQAARDAEQAEQAAQLRQHQEAGNALVMRTLTDTIAGVGRAYAQNQNETRRVEQWAQGEQARIIQERRAEVKTRAAQAEARTAEQRRVAQANLVAAQQRMQQARRQQIGAPASAGRMGSAGSAGQQADGSPHRWYYPESLAYCHDMEHAVDGETVTCAYNNEADPTRNGANGYANDRAFLDQIAGACTGKFVTTRSLGGGKPRRVYACGFGPRELRKGSLEDASGITDANLRRVFVCDAVVARCSTSRQ